MSALGRRSKFPVYRGTMMLVLAAVWWTGTTAIAEKPWAPWPLKTPSELKALHGPTFVGAQILTYHHSIEPPQPDTASETVIGIGRDFIFREEGKTRFVVDFRLGRIYQETDKRYVSQPIAANIAFFDYELANRTVMAKALAKANIPSTDTSDPFWAAVELKVTTPGDPPPAMETRNDNGETVFSYKGEEVLRWRPMSEPLPDISAVHLHHALLWLWPVHPMLAATLSAEGKAPRHLMVRTHVAFKSQSHDYELVGSRWCETCEALSTDAQPVPLRVGPDNGSNADLTPIMISASQGKFKPLSSADYLQRIDAALDRGATLEAYLWFIERLLQDGAQRCEAGDASERCRIQNRLFERAQTDPDVQTLRTNIVLRSIEAAKAIAALRDKVGANAYYIDLASMNALPANTFGFQAIPKLVQQQMKSALAAMPVVPAVYRDIGMIYYYAIDPWSAWFVWEMGQANPGRSAESDMWGFVRKLEQQVRQRRPEFF
jgi:hypothetical protein